jgi:hypothetical protein
VLKQRGFADLPRTGQQYGGKLGGQLLQDGLQVTWVIHNKIQFNLRLNLRLN